MPSSRRTTFWQSGDAPTLSRNLSSSPPRDCRSAYRRPPPPTAGLHPATAVDALGTAGTRTSPTRLSPGRAPGRGPGPGGRTGTRAAAVRPPVPGRAARADPRSDARRPGRGGRGHRRGAAGFGANHHGAAVPGDARAGEDMARLQRRPLARTTASSCSASASSVATRPGWTWPGPVPACLSTGTPSRAAPPWPAALSATCSIRRPSGRAHARCTSSIRAVACSTGRATRRSRTTQRAPAPLKKLALRLVDELRQRAVPDDASLAELTRGRWWSGPCHVLVVDDYDLLIGSMGGPFARGRAARAGSRHRARHHPHPARRRQPADLLRGVRAAAAGGSRSHPDPVRAAG